MGTSSSFSPLFVFGVARTGTNLIAGMLNAHGSVVLGLDPLMPLFKALRNAIVRECAPTSVAGRFDPSAPFQDYYFDSDGSVLLDTIMAGDMDLDLDPDTHQDVTDAIRTRASLESPQLGEQLVGLSGATFREVCDNVLERIACSSSGKKPIWVGTKEVWTVEFIPVLAAAYPEARFIVSQRDPRAVIASLVAQAAMDPTQSAHGVSYLRHWRKQVSVFSALLDDRALANRIRLQPYESLVRCPEDQATALCEFLAIPYTPEMLDPVTPEGRRFTGNSSYGSLAGISSEPAEHWRKVMTPAVRKAVEFHCGPEMVYSGYRLEERLPGALDDAVWQFVYEANDEPGSWRSDGCNPERDTVAEHHRWTLLNKLVGDCSEDEIRRHFLFESSYRRIRETMELSSLTTYA